MDMVITTQSAEEKLLSDVKKETAQVTGEKSQTKSVESEVEIKGEKPEGPTEKKEDVKSPKNDETKEETDPEQPEKKAEDVPKKKNHNGRRFDELTRDLGFYKTKAEALEAQMRNQRFEPVKEDRHTAVDSQAVPNKDDFADESYYNLAVLKWHVRNEMEQERALAQRNQTVKEFEKKVRDAKQGYDDYDDVMADAQSHPLFYADYPHITEKVVRSNYGPDLMYYLASNRDEADRVASMDPISAISYLTELEGYIRSALGEKEEVEKPGISKKVSRAPAPYETPAGSPAPSSNGKRSIYDTNLSRSDFKTLWQKETGQK
jgi:hypothetical protein